MLCRCCEAVGRWYSRSDVVTENAKRSGKWLRLLFVCALSVRILWLFPLRINTCVGLFALEQVSLCNGHSTYPTYERSLHNRERYPVLYIRLHAPRKTPAAHNSRWNWRRRHNWMQNHPPTHPPPTPIHAAQVRMLPCALWTGQAVLHLSYLLCFQEILHYHTQLSWLSQLFTSSFLQFQDIKWCCIECCNIFLMREVTLPWWIIKLQWQYIYLLLISWNKKIFYFHNYFILFFN